MREFPFPKIHPSETGSAVSWFLKAFSEMSIVVCSSNYYVPLKSSPRRPKYSTFRNNRNLYIKPPTGLLFYVKNHISIRLEDHVIELMNYTVLDSVIPLLAIYSKTISQKKKLISRYCGVHESLWGSSTNQLCANMFKISEFKCRIYIKGFCCFLVFGGFLVHLKFYLKKRLVCIKNKVIKAI